MQITKNTIFIFSVGILLSVFFFGIVVITAHGQGYCGGSGCPEGYSWEFFQEIFAQQAFLDYCNQNPNDSACVSAGLDQNQVAPILSVFPESMGFGNVPIGSTNVMNFNVTNSGGGTLIGSVSGLAAPFSCVSAGGCSYSLGAGMSQIISVGFTPQAEVSYSDTAIFSAQGLGSLNRSVSGTGIVLVLPPTDLSGGGCYTYQDAFFSTPGGGGYPASGAFWYGYNYGDYGLNCTFGPINQSFPNNSFYTGSVDVTCCHDTGGFQILPVTVSFNANPLSITTGDPSTLTWTSAGANECSILDMSNGNVYTGLSANGSMSVYPNSTRTYKLYCWNSTGGIATSDATITVSPPTVSPSTECGNWQFYSASNRSTSISECDPSESCNPATQGSCISNCAWNPLYSLNQDTYTCSVYACIAGPSCGIEACSLNQGQSCISAPNSCGQTNTGTIRCDGTCSVIPPPDSQCPSIPICNPNQGQSCVSAPNSCSQTQSNGTIQCDGSCSSTPPSNNSCPPTESLYVNPTTLTLTPGDTGQLAAIYTYDPDGPGSQQPTSTDVTNSANWFSQNSNVATVNNNTNKGLVSGVGVGITIIIAEYNSLSANPYANVVIRAPLLQRIKEILPKLNY